MKRSEQPMRRRLSGRRRWGGKTRFLHGPNDGVGDSVIEMAELFVDTERQAWFTPDSLASYLQVSDRMIRKWVAEGRLRSYKLDGCRRFSPDDVEEFVEQFRESGRAA